MQVVMKIGTVIGATFTGFVTGGVLVELDNLEQAFLPTTAVRGKTVKDRADRLGRIFVGIRTRVKVVNTYLGRNFKNKIEVKEVDLGGKTDPSGYVGGRRTGRVLADLTQL